jgi:hypothetical protein
MSPFQCCAHMHRLTGSSLRILELSVTLTFDQVYFLDTWLPRAGYYTQLLCAFTDLRS